MYCLYDLQNAPSAQPSEKNPYPIPQEQGMDCQRENFGYIEAMPTAVNYALLEKALTAFEAANKLLTIPQVALSSENKSRETAATLDCFAYYHPGPQEPQTYAKFLELLNSGIFHLLPYSAYHRQMNNFQNRFSANVSELYPFPSLGEAKGGFILSLSLQLLGLGNACRRHRIQLVHLEGN